MFKLISLFQIASKLFKLKDLLPSASTVAAVDGKKTYLVAIGFVLYGVGGFLTGQIDANEALRLIMEGLGFAFVRHAIDKSGGGGDDPPSPAVSPDDDPQPLDVTGLRNDPQHFFAVPKLLAV